VGSMFWKSAALNIAVMAIAMAASQAQAALENRGGGMIYDTVNNVTWLADMNYAQTSGFDTDGLMSWTAAKSWAENLSFGGFDGLAPANGKPAGQHLQRQVQCWWKHWLAILRHRLHGRRNHPPVRG
jgi:hypothetical protein